MAHNGIKIPLSVAKGLSEIYGPTGRTVHVYSNKAGSIRYLALRPEEVPPDTFPSHSTHSRIGHVDFEKMEIATPSATESTIDVPRLVRFVISIFKWILIAFIVVCVTIAAVFMAIAGTRNSR